LEQRSPEGSALHALIVERDELKRHCSRLDAEVKEADRAIRALIEERDALKGFISVYEASGYPPGHFYSPAVDVNDPHVIAAVDAPGGSPAMGVAFDRARALEWMRRLGAHHKLFPFPRTKEEPYRYYRENPFFGAGDAAVLFSMLLEFRPKRVVEVGCGFSSCLLLDTNEQFFGGSMQLTLIDPYLDTLREHFGTKGAPQARQMPLKLQDVPLEVFEELEAGDILFLDSSHVSKTGSDVNHYMFRILPRLRSGVVVHVHDIGFPFEYPREWVLEQRRNWNEAYLLQAFLQFNREFEILNWVSFADRELREEMAQLMPLCLEAPGGSLWLRRVGARDQIR
jgi:hypothetical protein